MYALALFMWYVIEMGIEIGIECLNRRTQLLLQPALKVAKTDFEPWIGEQLANERKSTPRLSKDSFRYGRNTPHWSRWIWEY